MFVYDLKCAPYVEVIMSVCLCATVSECIFVFACERLSEYDLG